MRIILYSPNASGGNFDYALKLFNTYKARLGDVNVSLVLPSNAPIDKTAGIRKILMNDKPLLSARLYSRAYFVLRSVLNPIIFFFYLVRINGNVIFNDFDQATSFLWVPLFKLVRKKRRFSVILHDPDRDKYFRRHSLSVATMERVMSIMDIAFFHELLPDRPYYSKNTNTIYVPVPHGLYVDNLSPRCNTSFFEALQTFKKGQGKLIGAIGNIRPEKNYPLIIRTLKEFAGIKLIIAGQPSNSSVDPTALSSLAMKEGVADRVMIVAKYLDAEEMNSVLKVCDAFILYYSRTFRSQSGILNILVGAEKPLLVSSGETPLSKLVQDFGLGLLAPPDSPEDLKAMLDRFMRNERPVPDWKGYRAYASWDNNVDIAVNAFERAGA